MYEFFQMIPLKHCADQLFLFTDILNTSLETSHVPACFKTSTSILRNQGQQGSDYRPVALTTVVMK